ncbi:hypothetical protein [Thermoleptolyngbya sp. M55_K2018_002]|uniref:hypothetical protein n=1 Tax=Thermoleptolyngbya sp. M55_K2018_002 TaxID=2747808 RepID=UPI0025FFEEFF|nr:hypothetical protein [Thermoleptolyngbya sp. M55_K2018_002]
MKPFTLPTPFPTPMPVSAQWLLAIAAAASVLGVAMPAGLAQERQGCFMITQTGRLIDLSDICPSAQPFTPPAQASSTPTLGTGDIQVTLRWTTTDDLDLAVRDPSGNIVAYYNRSVPSGGQLDVDANAGCGEQNTSPIENIFWPSGGAPQGQFSIEVNLFTRCPGGGGGSIPFNLTLLVQGTTRTIEGSVSDQQPVANFPFSLPMQAAQR